MANVASRSRSANTIDKIVGQNIRRYRRIADYTLSDFSEQIGISYQQIQKYESGTNRIPAGRLYFIAKILDKSVDELYDGADETQKAANDQNHLSELISKLNIDESSPEIEAAFVSLVAAIRNNQRPPT
jgi:transcriptional regulator with XRE-family HTH domain